LYAIVDIETTGGYASSNGITEIAIFIHDGNRVVKKFETLINPLTRVPTYITALTGITNDMLRTAPTFAEVAPTIYELLQPNIFVAHNVNFDFSFVKHQLKICDYNLQVQKLCTVRLAKKVFPHLPSYSLGKLCNSLNININNRHRAGGDAAATVIVLEQCLANQGQQHINTMLIKNSKEQWLPMHINRTAIDALPNTPGVYYFKDAKQKIVYVGKAIDLKKRVASHFTSNAPDRKRQNLLRDVYHISHVTCATELEAIVLESTEIKRLWPKHNAAQKEATQKWGLYTYTDAKGYQRLFIDKKKKNLPVLYAFNNLTEGQTLLKKMIAEFTLHDKLCGINKTSLQAQDWAAIGTPQNYNQQVQKATTALAQQLPTFAVIDEGLLEGELLCLLIEKGSFWGMGYVHRSQPYKKLESLKTILTPYADNDYIRNSIYQFVAQNPKKRIDLT
jgi:DNA polymerase III subunit epsilon